jgi:hypothetical protein
MCGLPQPSKIIATLASVIALSCGGTASGADVVREGAFQTANVSGSEPADVEASPAAALDGVSDAPLPGGA